MNANLLLDRFDALAAEPGAIPKLRRLVLDLAVRGKLVPQEAGDEPTEVAYKPLSSVETPFEVPSNWRWHSINHLAKIFAGDSASATVRGELAKVKEGRPFISTKDVGYGFDSLDYANGLRVASDDSRFKVAEPDTVFICAEGGSAGRKCGQTTEKVSFGNKLIAAEAGESLHPRFLLTWYQTESFFEEFRSRMTGVIGGISQKNFKSLPVPLPPLAEQKRIVARVDELMTRLDALEEAQGAREGARARLTAASHARLSTPSETFKADAGAALSNLTPLTTRPAQVEALRQTILSLTVRGKLVAQDPADEPAELLLERIKMEKARLESEGHVRKQKTAITVTDAETWFSTPKGWTWARLMEIGQTQTGTSPSSSKSELFGSHIPFVKPADLDGNSISYDGPGLSCEGINHSRVAAANSVLMVCIGATLGKVNVTNREVCFNQQINSVTPYLKGMHSFFALALRSQDFQERAWARAGIGTLPIISKGKWEVLPIPLPPLAEQRRIVEKVDRLMALCDRLERALSEAETTSAKLLDAAIRDALEPSEEAMEAAE